MSRSVMASLGLLLASSALAPIAATAQQPIYTVVVEQNNDPLLANLNIPNNAADVGMWSGVVDWPIVAIHSTLLPDGRVLTFGAPPGATVQDGRTLVFWDPRKGLNKDAFLTLPNAQNVDSFCASATLLSDGRLLTSGGATFASGYSSHESMLMDWRTSSAVRDADLTAPRWYATMTKLADGRAVITGGGVPYANGDPNRDEAGNDISSTPEVYTPGEGWRSLVGAYSTDAFGAKNTRWWYPRQWVSPTGSLFGISTEKVWEMHTEGDGSIRTLGTFKTPADKTTRPNVGPTSTAVMYDTSKIIQVGGNGYYNGYDSPSSASASVFDISGIASGRINVRNTASMKNARQWANATVLPTGKVLVTGGSSGIGTTAIMLAHALGAKSIVTAGSDAKLQACRDLGADHGINYRTQDFVAEVKRITENKGVNVILDMVGGSYVQRNFECAAMDARIVQIAFQQGYKIDGFDLRPISAKRLVYTGSALRPRTVAQKGAIARSLEEAVGPLWAKGKCKPLIDSTFPLRDAAKAHARMETSEHIGKIVMTV